MSKERPAALVATLGTQPEVVTIALDLLLDAGVNVDKVYVIHTAAFQAGDRMDESLRALCREFPGETHYHYRAREARPCQLSLVLLEAEGQPLHDIRDQNDARAVMNTLFNVVRELKMERHAIHLSIAGGRKSMSVYGMAVAQLLFDGYDRLWHVFSTAPFEKESLMHPRGAEDARLVPIPVLPVSAVFPGMVTLMTSRDPLSLLDDKLMLMDLEGRRDREAFLTRLTPSERDLVDRLMRPMLSEGHPPDDRELARRMVLAPRTVTKRFSHIYAKLREHIQALDEESVDRTALVYYLAPYFADLPPP